MERAQFQKIIDYQKNKIISSQNFKNQRPSVKTPNANQLQLNQASNISNCASTP